ncbi:MAG: TetR/AcrR family transcriptional regulator [Bacteroidales bacterium]|nr:TetR/AcrR family transcriptional regulator [Bacteroidales bacterium]
MQTERQKEIVNAAMEIINANGIQGLTIKNMAQRIGITEPAIYRHFENKIDILIAVLDLFKENTERIFEVEIAAKKNAVDKIEHLFNCHISAFTKSPTLVSIVFSEEIFRNEAILVDKIKEIIEKNHGILRAIISKGQVEDEIRTDLTANQLAIIIMGTLKLFVKKWQLANFEYDLKTEGDSMIAALLLLIKKK